MLFFFVLVIELFNTKGTKKSLNFKQMNSTAIAQCRFEARTWQLRVFVPNCHTAVNAVVL